MLFTPENAAGEAQLLSDALSLPVRIYLSPWGVPAACKASRQLCGCFVCDGELLRLAGEQEGDCVIFLTADYGESAVLLGARTPQGRQFAVLGPAAAAGAAVPGEAFPAWDAAGFQRIHRYLPVRTARQMEAAARLAARALGLHTPAVVRQGAQARAAAAPRTALPFPEVPCTPQEYRRQVVRCVRRGDRVGLARIQVLYTDLNTPAPVGEGALRTRKNDFIRFLSLLADTALGEGADFADLMGLTDTYVRQAERLAAFDGLTGLYHRAAYDCVRRVAAQKGLPGAPGPVDEVLDRIEAGGCALSAGEIARQLGFTTQQLNRQFKAVMGFSLSDYITLYRMARARYLLCTEMPIADVARTVHFSSVNGMDAAFRRFLGLSPLAYRRIKLNST